MFCLCSGDLCNSADDVTVYPPAPTEKQTWEFTDTPDSGQQMAAPPVSPLARWLGLTISLMVAMN